MLHLVLAALLAGCPESPADPTEVAPDSTTAVLGVDVDAFARTSTGSVVLAALTADLALAEALEVASDCKLALDQTYALVLARDAGDGRMLAVQARGLGEAATLECLATELRARGDGADPWVRERAGCFDSLALADGSRIWITNAFTLIWARGGMLDGVAAKLDGTAPLGLPAPLAPVFDRLDRSGHLWLAANLSDTDRQALPGVWAREATSFGLSVDLSQGLRAAASLSATTVAALASTRERVLGGLIELAERLDQAGVEHRLREHARVGIVDGVVVAELELGEAELREIRERIGEKIVGRGPL